MFPSVDTADEHGLVGIGADLLPGTLLTAYRSGVFPMPVKPGGPMAWWSPDPRGVLELADLRVSRSLRRSLARFEIRIDTAFREVVSACANPKRGRGWIDDRMTSAYAQLHELGWAHSIEAWDQDGLAGGLYGVSIGGIFAGESMFYRRSNASKVALCGLVTLLNQSDTSGLIDIQWCTPHLKNLGSREISRTAYLERLGTLKDLEGPDWKPGLLHQATPFVSK